MIISKNVIETQEKKNNTQSSNDDQEVLKKAS